MLSDKTPSPTAALDLIRSARAGMMRRLMTPWWYPIASGLVCAVSVLDAGLLFNSTYRMACLVATLVLIVPFALLHRLRRGLPQQNWHDEVGPSLVGTTVLIGTCLLARWQTHLHDSPWPAMGCATITFIVIAWTTLLTDRAWRARIAGAGTGGAS